MAVLGYSAVDCLVLYSNHGLVDSMKNRLFELYRNDRRIYTFLNIRWWHASLEKISHIIPKEGNILDLGCGYGFFSNLIGLINPKCRVIGVDLQEHKINRANKNLVNVKFFNRDIVKDNFPENKCDCIVLLDVMHHLNSYSEQIYLLQKCIQNLNKGGRIILKDIDKKPLWKYWITLCVDNLLYWGDSFYFRDEIEWTEVLTEHGLQITFVPIHKGKILSHVIYIGVLK